MNKAEETAALLGIPRRGDRVVAHFVSSDTVLAGVILGVLDSLVHEYPYILDVSWDNATTTYCRWPHDPTVVHWLQHFPQPG